MSTIPARLGHLLDLLSGVAALGAGGGALSLAQGALTAALGASGLAESLKGARAHEAAGALAAFRARAERDWRDWAGEDAEAAIADFDDFLARHAERAIPAPPDIAHALDAARAAATSAPAALAAERLAEAALLRAQSLAPEFYADTAERAPSRRFLRNVIAGALGALLDDPAFLETLRPAMEGLLSRKLDRLAEGQSAIGATVAEEAARTRGQLDALGDELKRMLAGAAAPSGLSQAQAAAILRGFGETAAPEDPAQIAALLSAKAAEMRALQARLSGASGHSDTVDALRAEASAAIESGDFAAAKARLIRARARAREIRAETERRLEAGRAAEIETLTQLAQLARLGFDHVEEAERWADARALTPPGRRRRIWRLAVAEARALAEHGRMKGDNAALRRAAALIEEVAAPLAPRRAHPRDWAATQIALAGPLATLGERARGPHGLLRAAECYRTALDVLDAATDPREHAAALCNLGHVLRLIGERDGDEERLREAESTLADALRAPGLRDDAVLRAGVWNNLGAVLKLLGQRAGDPEKLRAAVAAHETALAMTAEADAPRAFATTNGNLGAALRMLGAWERDPDALQRAVCCYRAARRARPRAVDPVAWAQNSTNLANALQTLGQLANDDAAVDEAVETYRDALTARDPDVSLVDWGMTVGNLGVALIAQAERAAAPEAGRAAAAEAERRLCAAAAAMEEAGREAHARYYDERADEARALRREEACP